MNTNTKVDTSVGLYTLVGWGKMKIANFAASSRKLLTVITHPVSMTRDK